MTALSMTDNPVSELHVRATDLKKKKVVQDVYRREYVYGLKESACQ